MKHTRKKWEVKGVMGKEVVYIQAGKKVLATIFSLEDGIDNAERIREAEANAHLIAAAPTGYELAEEVIEQLKNGLDRWDFIVKKAQKFMAIAKTERS